MLLETVSTFTLFLEIGCKPCMPVGSCRSLSYNKTKRYISAGGAISPGWKWSPAGRVRLPSDWCWCPGRKDAALGSWSLIRISHLQNLPYWQVWQESVEKKNRCKGVWILRMVPPLQNCSFCENCFCHNLKTTRPDSSSRRTIAATYRRRPTPCSHTSTAQRGHLAAIATQLLRRYSATRCSVTLLHSTWVATAALRRSCHHGTYLLEYAEVTSIKCTAADDWLTLPESERHGTVEVELQSTACRDNKMFKCQVSQRRCTALGTTHT